MARSLLQAQAGPRGALNLKRSRTALFVVIQLCLNQLFSPIFLVLLLASQAKPVEAAPLNFNQAQVLRTRSTGGPGQPDTYLVTLVPGSDMTAHLAWLADAIAANGGAPSPYPGPPSRRFSRLWRWRPF